MKHNFSDITYYECKTELFKVVQLWISCLGRVCEPVEKENNPSTLGHVSLLKGTPFAQNNSLKISSV